LKKSSQTIDGMPKFPSYFNNKFPETKKFQVNKVTSSKLAYFVTACIAFAKGPTFFDVTPAMLIRPFLVM